MVDYVTPLDPDSSFLKMAQFVRSRLGLKREEWIPASDIFTSFMIAYRGWSMAPLQEDGKDRLMLGLRDAGYIKIGERGRWIQLTISGESKANAKSIPSTLEKALTEWWNKRLK